MSDKLETWKKLLKDSTEMVLPTDYPRTSLRIVDAEITRLIKDSTSLAILKTSMKTSNPFSIILGAFVGLLHRYTGEEDISIGSLSPKLNPLCLRLNILNTDSLYTIIDKVNKCEQFALENEIDIDELVKEFSEKSLFRVRFLNLADAALNKLSNETSSQCDLTVSISMTNDLRKILPIQIKIVYNSVLFSASRIEFILDQLEQLLVLSSENIDAPIDTLNLVTDTSALILPNPTASLHWSDYKGSITSIFSKNAKLFPNQVCVSTNEANYDYKTINEASNILAHYLVKNGITREDVVVLYSYRGVDLVVAVMGVLKSGATFSVIDPAYPANRQNVYLSVSKPKGLVILKEAGELGPEVRKYVGELGIVCEISALHISTTGVLFGGIGKDGKDCLESYQQYKDQDLNIELGPDSIGTLSFTSGSTGIPKGVRGRHYSLTHFFPWMMQEFGLCKDDRFTMLSGIAHDPIQRDIFTPLFMGARICVPSADDIGIPGRLAEWMAEQQITVTHLTPAMGQLLSANATQPMPTLKNAFFVGDVLTKKDVMRLQHLATNTRVINMYGTTETQRAVSYLAIPPASLNPGYLSEQKDIMPAGKGMQNVQLLILNKAGLLAGVGEVGEIYVRSGGLAEGYLGLPEATNEKFIPNPFSDGKIVERKEIPYYLGDRDRMYRTGDLGRYLPDGNVECTGRSDDQVKIRGFRIELKEIDTHMSQHPSVRETVTLIRRDKDEEKTLVNYFVPLHEISDAGKLIKDIRDFLRQKLPSYAVPSVFVPLTKMPLTPNGKIDKNALPFPDTALAAANATSATVDDNERTPLQNSLRQVWSTLLKIPANQIQLGDNFFDLGGHSILATQMVFELRQSTALEVPLGLIYKAPVLSQLASEIDFLRGGDLNLTRLAASGESPIATTMEQAPKAEKTEKPIEVFQYYPDLELVDDASICDKGLPPVDYDAIFKSSHHPHFFVTGVTGFLGAFIISSIFKKFSNQCKITCLVRAKTEPDAKARVKDNLVRHLIWNDVWESQIDAVCGDLGKDNFGLSNDKWNELCINVDAIIHNGALVHWVYPYQKLRAPNVLGTKTALVMATTLKLKPINFVSSTSVLDTNHYTAKLVVGASVYESDNLLGSKTGLNSGYGQTKWVAEQLVMRAKSRGVPATILRPGYIVGDSARGVTNTDDFIWRLIKGCIQLGQAPRISNVVNMCSVDYVADCTVEITTSPKSVSLGVFHTWNPHHLKFDEMFSFLIKYYAVKPVEYIHWRTALMDLTLKTADHALFPLLHFVVDDLPTSTKNPELDDSNMREVLKTTSVKCTGMMELIPLYLGYLCHVGFLDKPSETLPSRDEWENIKGGAVSRSGA